MKTPGTLYIISAPSGAGKSSLIKALLESDAHYQAKVSVSHTTRQKRPGEIEGQHYYFVDHQAFESMIEQHAFLEFAYVFEQYYGTSKSTIAADLAQGFDVFLDIDWQGARQVRQQAPYARSIFILPPSQADLYQRLIKRGQDSQQTIEKRMQKAVAEMSHYDEYDYLIINDQFDTALSELKSLVRAEKLKTAHQQIKYQQLITKLLAQ